jgi:hypothetical protein
MILMDVLGDARLGRVVDPAAQEIRSADLTSCTKDEAMELAKEIQNRGTSGGDGRNSFRLMWEQMGI